MNKLEEILQKQNDTKMLKCQFAARECFNQAELFLYVSWLFSIFSAFTLFLPNSDSPLILLTPFGIDIIAYLFHFYAEKKVNIASRLRNFFDCVVLNINPDQLQDNEVKHLWEIVNDICHKHPAKCQVQINHTGRNNPPGVKNWYEFFNNESDQNPVFECQRQNCWWNNKLCSKRLMLVSLLFCVLIAVSIIVNVLFNIGWLRIVVCFTALLINAIDLIRANIHYMRLSSKMNAILETPDIDKHPVQIEYLQELIGQRREILVLEINMLHKKFAKKWSEIYEEIAKDSSNNK